MRRGRYLSGLLALALLSFAGDALADARTEARSHFKKGMTFIAAGKYEDGIGELQRAYEILPHPNVLYNIARAHAEAGDLEDALRNYKKYLEGNPPDRAEVEQVVTNLDGRLKRQQQAREASTQPVVPPKPDPLTVPIPLTVPVPAPTTKPVAPPGPPVAPPPNAELGETKTDVFEESVVTASKGAQSPLDAPSSTSIITEQDIRLSGITKIPELLRRLAGVDIMEVTGGDTQVSLRGFNQRLSNKILVLVNGRSVYVDLLGSTFWQALSVGVEDIERIEVVRGPGSALYGADAFNGVVNIITKAPGEGKSGVNVGYGDHNQTHGSFWASGRDKEFGWRASAGYDYLPRWSREVQPGRTDVHLFRSDQETASRTSRFDLRGTRRIVDGVSVGLGGGISQGSLEILGIGPLNDIILSDFTSSDITAQLTSKHIEARVFWNRFRTPFGLNAAQIGQTLLPGRADQNVVDGEVQYLGKFETGQGIEHDLHVGVAYRYKEVAWTYLDRERFEHHQSLFVHDEIKLGQRFGVVGDYRLDYVPYLERFVQSPRGTVMFHPTKQSTLRATVATAFRKPTFLESYLNNPVQLPFAGGALLSEGVRSDDRGFKVKPENNLSAELGYLNQESDLFVVDSTIFYNRAKNLIQLAPNRPITVGDLNAGLGKFDPQTGFFPLFLGGFDNQCQLYNVYGAEVGVRTFPVEGLDVYANYTLNLVDQDNSQCSKVEQAIIVKDARTSAHKVNAGVQLRTSKPGNPGLDGSVDFHYVSPQTWGEQVVNAAAQRIEYQPFQLSAYMLLNARLGFRFMKDQAEVSVMAFNLLGQEHREHPFGQVIGRRVMGNMTYRF